MRDGRYGPYVNVGKINATLPKGKDPPAVTLEEAIQLMNERAEKTGKKPNAKKAPAKKPRNARRRLQGKAADREGRWPKPSRRDAPAKKAAPANRPQRSGRQEQGGRVERPASAGGRRSVPWDAD